jgi:hypothetical protein
VPVDSDLTEREETPRPAGSDGPSEEAGTEIAAGATAPATTNGGPSGGDGASSPVQARRVRRILRRIDPWSVLKLSFIFFACMYAVIVVSSLLVWRAAVSAGVVDDVEGFVVDLGFNDFQFAPEQMLRALLYGGAGMIIVATFLAVLITVLFNLISDLVGGIRVSMIEQQLLGGEQE